MSANEMARKHYKQTQKAMGMDAEIELKVFTDITARLAVDINKPGGITQLNQALIDNTKLWKIIFIDITHPDNKLSESLKANLIYLADFTFTHTQKVLRGEADPSILIEINNNVISGKRAFLDGANSINPDNEEAA